MKNGVLSPDVKLELEGPFKAQQIDFFQELKTQDDAADVLKQKFVRLSKAMDENAQHTLIISAENLSLIRNLPAVLAKESKSFFDEVGIIFYIRRQDDYLISAWQQWGLKTQPDFATYVKVSGLRMGDWCTLARPWEDAFGQKQMIVRPFRRDHLAGGDVVEDFLSVLNLSSDGCKPLGGLANRSFDEHLGDLAHRCQEVFDGPHDNKFYDVMIRTIGEASFKSRAGSHLLSLQERLDLLAEFEEGNEVLKQRYVPDLGDVPLFELPIDRDVVKSSAEEKLAAENALLTRAVYHLAQRVEALEKKKPTFTKNDSKDSERDRVRRSPWKYLSRR
ncbi:MAG: hypothetical protein ABJH85_05205 [Paracoccaceae bacterium]